MLEGQTYVVGGYLAILAALLILAGALADYYGRRRLFAIGLTGFGITSVLCGLAPTLELLVVFAAARGGGRGAARARLARDHHRDVRRPGARSRAIGLWAAAAAATGLIGPVVGGLLVDIVTWRAAFLINVPLVILALVARCATSPRARPSDASARFDWLGAVVAIVAVGGLAFGAIRGQEAQLAGPRGLGRRCRRRRSRWSRSPC